MAMGCTVRDAALPKADEIRVNGVAIPRDLIARDVQHHPARGRPIHCAARDRGAH